MGRRRLTSSSTGFKVGQGRLLEAGGDPVAWDLGELWRAVDRTPTTVTLPTRAFVERWARLVVEEEDLSKPQPERVKSSPTANARSKAHWERDCTARRLSTFGVVILAPDA